jgi:hypothetical protein
MPYCFPGFLQDKPRGHAYGKQVRTHNHQAAPRSQHPTTFSKRALRAGHMFQNLVHSHGIKCPVVEGELLNICRHIRNGRIDLLCFQGTGMKVCPKSIMTFFSQQPCTPA